MVVEAVARRLLCCVLHLVFVFFSVITLPFFFIPWFFVAAAFGDMAFPYLYSFVVLHTMLPSPLGLNTVFMYL